MLLHKITRISPNLTKARLLPSPTKCKPILRYFSDRRTRIANLLSPKSNSQSLEPDTIVLNAPKPIYAGTLSICPTPIGNLDDMTLEAYHRLNETDIVACEDKKIAKKLFENLEKKKLGEKFRNFFEQKMLLNDYNYDTEQFFRNR